MFLVSLMGQRQLLPPSGHKSQVSHTIHNNHKGHCKKNNKKQKEEDVFSHLIYSCRNSHSSEGMEEIVVSYRWNVMGYNNVTQIMTAYSLTEF